MCNDRNLLEITKSDIGTFKAFRGLICRLLDKEETWYNKGGLNVSVSLPNGFEVSPLRLRHSFTWFSVHLGRIFPGCTSRSLSRCPDSFPSGSCSVGYLCSSASVGTACAGIAIPSQSEESGMFHLARFRRLWRAWYSACSLLVCQKRCC